MNELLLDTRWVGPGKRVLIIAELGVNHDGSAQRAIELVTAAASCGADAVKLQLFRANALMHASSMLADYQKQRVKAENPIDMLRKYELPFADVRRIVQRIRELNMIPLATPFSSQDLETVEALRLPAIKIASPDLVNRPLLERAAEIGKPLLISTGAASMDEVATTVSWLADWNCPFALLHCISAYPTPNPLANLCWIHEIARAFDCPVGYSDHTTDVGSGALATAAGACIIEKHLTYDRTAKGPDHAASADPQQFERYVRRIREAEVLCGTPGKTVLPIEEDVRTVSRQSLVVRRSLQAGEMLRTEDLTFQRPGTGLPAAMIAQAVGRRINRAVQAGAMLQWDMLTDAA
ncbi:MAG TPA: N-acetylneuraminate synthase family protein [Tepidisphaeraceae bacterium]|nr:N-acetylneuraminate synthase family protein [Tepidisphaeraceae bacterium]